MYKKSFICLANSTKPPSGRCIAGKVIGENGFQEWIRPISSRGTHEVSDGERQYPKGRGVFLIDLVEVELSHPHPIDFQVENHTFNTASPFSYKGKGTWEDVLSCIDTYDPRFWRHGSDTQHGLNDKIHTGFANQLGSSLKLIRVNELKVIVATEPGYRDNPPRQRARGQFVYMNKPYRLSISDPVVESNHLQKGDGTYIIEDAAICVSVVEPFNGYTFRVIASVITQKRCQN